MVALPTSGVTLTRNGMRFGKSRGGSIGFLLTAGLAVSLPSSAAELPKGQVLERVECAADAKQGYALYVPTSYAATRKWPVLFCFDPAAHGRIPVERFSAAAEKYGWIVAGSNNSRNGPWEANAAAISAMVKDVDHHFPLDARRVYAAGLSGGARVACQVALLGIAHGVISCSAAFAGSETPPKVTFPFFGTTGVTDFNYLELRRVDRELDDQRAVHRVVIHAGGHEWLPAPLADEALAWLELQAMRSGLREKDEQWITEQFITRQTAVPAAPPDENLRALKSLVADFKGLADTAGLERKIATLAATPDVRAAQKAERAAERREQSLVEDFVGAVREGMASSVRKTAADLRNRESNGAPDERQMATRVLQSAYMSCAEPVRAMLRTGDYDEALPLLELMTIIRPERPTGWFDLARARAKLHDKKGATAALQTALAAGFNDAARVRSAPEFAALKGEPAFIALLSAMKSD